MTQQELLLQQTNSDNHKENNNNTKITDREQIGDSPFWALMVNNKWFLALGDSRITEPYDTKEQAIERLDLDKWKIIMQLIIIFIEKINESKQN